MHPQAIVDLILYYDWKSVIYIYQSSENLIFTQINLHLFQQSGPEILAQ